jgi:hypothetical protein
MNFRNLSATLAVALVVLFTGCKEDDYNAIVEVCPAVFVTSPEDGEVNVPINTTVTATFNKKMNGQTITDASFKLRGSSIIVGEVTYTDSTASFNPNTDLAPNRTYEGRITTLAMDGMGQPLQTDHVWTFSTGATLAPMVIFTSPLYRATGVALDKTITATFSVEMDAATINAISFTVNQDGAPIDGTVSFEGSTVSFVPATALQTNTTYTGIITSDVENALGIALEDDYEWIFNTSATTGNALVGVDLKSVFWFGIIAGVGVSNNAGFSEIRDLNVGIYPGVRSSITGFPPAILVNGVMYASDDIFEPGIPALLLQAKNDLVEAYLFAEKATSPAPATVSGDQGGTTLAPGIYKSTSTLLIESGDLTLDAQGDDNAVWIFQIASDFTTVGGAGGNVILTNGAKAKNVYWQTGSSATIGDGTSFKGNILALTSITMNSGAVAEGRMLARNGSVVMTNTNIITKPKP